VQPLLGLLALGAGVGLHLDQFAELSLEEASRVSLRLGEHLELRAGGQAVLDDPVWPECTRADRCLDDLRSRTQAKELVFLRVFGGPTKIRLIAERLEPNGKSTTAQRNLPRDREPWPEELASLALELYPTPLAREGEELVQAPIGRSVEADTGSYYPLIPIGAALVLAGVGVGFGLSSASASDRIMSVQLGNEEYESELTRSEDHRVVAFVLFGSALVAVITGVILWVAD
jgi:hypothetical protein